MERVKTAVAIGTGVVGGGIASLFGGWDSVLQVLLTVMAIDYVTGLMVAGVFKKSTKTESGALQSNAGWKGLCKKSVTLFMVLIAYQLEIVTGSDFIRDAVIIAYIGIEILSVVENAGQMGVPLPAPLKNAVDILTDKNNTKGE